MDDCIFCKIIKGEIPHEHIYEDDNVFAFLSNRPNNPGHTLVIPKEHATNLTDASGESLRSLISVVPKIAQAVMTALDYSGFNLIANNGSVAGQEVFHLHFHIVPRREDDGHKPWAETEYAEGEMAAVAEKIRQSLLALKK